jgi:uncharacterized phage protein (TIGR01671 family)
MKTIKFRAWDTKNKEWLSGIPPHEYMLDSDEWDRRDCDYGSGENILTWPQSPFPIFGERIQYEQFTGLKDKNGKEIYEGDLIQCMPGKEYYRLVIWVRDQYCLVQPESTPVEAVLAFPLGVVCKDNSHEDSVVVGNIHENLELFR